MHNEGVNDPQDKRMTLSTVFSLSIRPCEEADIPAITEIYRDAVLYGRASFEIDPPDVATMAERRRLLVEGNYPYLVAEHDGKVAGYAYAGAYRARPAYGATVEDSVYIDPAMKGMGIGRKLLDALIAEATARGFRQMIAVIGDSANAASVGVHRAAGFELVGTFKSIGWKHGQWLDTVLMQRALGEGDTTPRF
ncbi:phosphinothricin acetyltransferase (PPT N-acetyltransferase) [Agrobacterium fabrum str. J-07]|uniref:Phosphinothricin acetyltransferase n=2 Tax=Agrobacterium fabrum TaxID=1176649 RepID=A0A7Z7FQB7_9HYPH|nr:L-amino acid N-acyltransferase YncA [Agrobacterium fabrum]CUX22682.1 phosphinothricin acetyltransferase (PPT N-acetyltransferase) [Agrobacterium fabrum str. J-07]CAH0259101.1 L-methionine sulfoximine/L-methionine sulfone acetyltransferase [Agrobacterium fabrum]CAH0269038.1 L-methionine sulfoximine/L-methionine sulfone acetyltransferase [Agrobacterium fabrum]SDB28196.1 phosphinothricin acetyltransferase [Agrobacterium fabrum]